MIIDRWMNIISEIDPKLLDLDGSVLQIKRGDPVDVWRPDGDGGERTSRQSYLNLKNEDLMVRIYFKNILILIHKGSRGR